MAGGRGRPQIGSPRVAVRRCDAAGAALGSAAGLEALSSYRQVTVANIKSQIKRNRQNEKRRLRNRTVRSEMATRSKAALDAEADEAGEALRTAVKRIDKAAAKGVIHKNTAARRKSRLVRDFQSRQS